MKNSVLGTTALVAIGALAASSASSLVRPMFLTGMRKPDQAEIPSFRPLPLRSDLIADILWVSTMSTSLAVAVNF